MNRNQMNRFAIAPTNIDIGRSIFPRDHSVKFSFDVGQLVPFLCEECLPGDTWTTSTSKVVRVQPLVTPIFDNLYLDTYYFFVPNRLVWNHWVNFMGENTDSAWIPQVERNIPKITAPMPGGWNVGTIADYLGIPPLNMPSDKRTNFRYNSLPFRAYALICDQWFRDENLMQPLSIPFDDSVIAGSNGSDQVTDIVKGGSPFIVCKYHDYFTSCLPAPQKGPTTAVPVNSLLDYGLPVYASSDGYIFQSSSQNPISPSLSPSQGKFSPGAMRYRIKSTDSWSSDVTSSQNIMLGISQKTFGSPVSSISSPSELTPENLFALVQNQLSIDVSSMRTAFAIQKYYEKLARSGSRYIESIKAFYGVTSPDARMQRAEYLGGNRVPLNISQVENVTNTSQNVDPIGSVAGLSVTGDVNHDFQFSCTEHGYIIGVCCVRFNHTYQQSVEPHFFRNTIFDYYNPVFANISEQPVYKRVICDVDFAGTQASVDALGDVFGYQEAWADYRFKPSRVAGMMRSVYSQSLDVWHLADYYASLPSLSPEWIREDKSVLDRCLAVTSDVSNQLIADFYIQSKVSRPMPLYSIPGLIDHH